MEMRSSMLILFAFACGLGELEVFAVWLVTLS